MILDEIFDVLEIPERFAVWTFGKRDVVEKRAAILVLDSGGETVVPQEKINSRGVPILAPKRCLEHLANTLVVDLEKCALRYWETVQNSIHINVLSLSTITTTITNFHL